MYVVQVFHGYITTDGHRTVDKGQAKIYQSRDHAERFANLIGGRVKELTASVKAS
ncbi:hypothetical protein [Enterococcus nangangensis]|uniref:hypothetical protein n=1 Tax=Enterococcus nangangensis TaxID=2559926 RepID=UPI001484E0C3|nr:hypothetical protein [Enterococcus nangangensis]